MHVDEKLVLPLGSSAMRAETPVLLSLSIAAILISLIGAASE
jgi:hypothetical protein